MFVLLVLSLPPFITTVEFLMVYYNVYDNVFLQAHCSYHPFTCDFTVNKLFVCKLSTLTIKSSFCY